MNTHTKPTRQVSRRGFLSLGFAALLTPTLVLLPAAALAATEHRVMSPSSLIALTDIRNYTTHQSACTNGILTYYAVFGIGLPDIEAQRYAVVGPDGKLKWRPGEPTMQCTGLIKGLSDAPQTSKWKPGRRVMDGNVAIGTAVATFVNGIYSGHCAFFGGYTPDSIILYSQNWFGNFRCLIRHEIRSTNMGLSDPRRYYVITS